MAVVKHSRRVLVIVPSAQELGNHERPKRQGHLATQRIVIDLRSPRLVPPGYEGMRISPPLSSRHEEVPDVGVRRVSHQSTAVLHVRFVEAGSRLLGAELPVLMSFSTRASRSESAGLVIRNSRDHIPNQPEPDHRCWNP